MSISAISFMALVGCCVPVTLVHFFLKTLRLERKKRLAARDDARFAKGADIAKPEI